MKVCMLLKFCMAFCAISMLPLFISACIMLTYCYQVMWVVQLNYAERERERDCPTTVVYCSFLCMQALLPVLLPCHTINIACMFFSSGKSGRQPPHPPSPYSPTGWNCWTQRSSTPTWTSRSSWCLAPSLWLA